MILLSFFSTSHNSIIKNFSLCRMDSHHDLKIKAIAYLHTENFMAKINIDLQFFGYIKVLMLNIYLFI